MNSRSLTLEQAKSRITIHFLWEKFNVAGKPSKSCRCPWRDDRKPSFSVSEDGLLYNDFGTGQGGDAVDFLANVTGLSVASACRLLLDFAGSAPPSTPAPRATKGPKPKPRFPAMDSGTEADIEALSKLRGIPLAGLQWAVERGVLRFMNHEQHPERAWVVTDAEGVNAQARRLDGTGWDHLEGNPKAWTLPGSWASWPIGIREAESFQSFALCEGAPDLLAAHYIALREQVSHPSKRDTKCAPVAMLGAGLRIHENALELFREKQVRIFAHDDEAGRRAATVWAQQLRSVGVTPDAYNFAGLVRADGQRAKDLNDCLLLNEAGFAEIGEEMMPL